MSSWAPVIRDIQVHGNRVTKRATIGRDKLIREHDWLVSIPEPLKKHVPTPIEIRIGENWAEYDMPYRPWKNFAEVVLAGDIGVSEACTRLKLVLEFSLQLAALSSEEVDQTFLHQNYIHKFVQRRDAILGRDADFDRLLNAEELKINSQLCLGPGALLRRFELDEHALSHFIPERLAFFHGDFKLDNFLLGPSKEDFWLIDPRGATASGGLHSHPQEDIAKLRTSTFNHYDLVRRNAYHVEVEEFSIRYELKPEWRTSFDFLQRLDREVLRLFKTAFPHVSLDTLIFIQGMLLIANAPFQLINTEADTREIAIILFVFGIEMLNQVL